MLNDLVTEPEVTLCFSSDSRGGQGESYPQRPDEAFSRFDPLRRSGSEAAEGLLGARGWRWPWARPWFGFPYPLGSVNRTLRGLAAGRKRAMISV